MKIGFNKTVDELYEANNNENCVTIDDTINIDAVEGFVVMYNEDYSLSRIKSNLEQDDRLTGDEVDELMSALSVLEELCEKVSETKEQSPWSEEVKLEQSSKEIKKVLEGGDIDHMKELPKTKKTRQPRISTAPGVSTKKSITPQDYMEILQEKMNLTKLLSVTVAPEIPDGLTKLGRILMIEFSVDYNKLIVEYLERIQSL